MKSEQLKRMIEIAKDNGWDEYDIINPHNIISIEDCGLIRCCAGIKGDYHINEILFDPEFGKGYWGKRKVCKDCGQSYYIDDAGYCSNCESITPKVSAFQYHQSELGGMSTKERNEYMANDLKRRRK